MELTASQTAAIATLDGVTEALTSGVPQTRASLFMAATMLDSVDDGASTMFLKSILAQEDLCTEAMLELATEGLIDSVKNAYKKVATKFQLMHGRIVTLGDRIAGALNPFINDRTLDSRRNAVESFRQSKIMQWLKYGAVLVGLIAAGGAAIVAGKSIVAAEAVIVKQTSAALGLAGESATKWPSASALRAQFAAMGDVDGVGAMMWDRHIAQTILKESGAFIDKVKWLGNEIKHLFWVAWNQKRNAVDGVTTGVTTAAKLTESTSALKTIKTLNKFLYGAVGFLIIYFVTIVNKLDKDAKAAYKAYKRKQESAA